MDIRDEILKAIKNEIVGPSPNPNYIDSSTGEEILLDRVHGSPKSRYGAGMLYPRQSAIIENDDPGDQKDTENIEEGETSESPNIESENQSSSYSGSESSEEEPVRMANQYLPSAMGFTVRFKKNEERDDLTVNIKSAYYVRGSGELPKRRANQSGQIEDVVSPEGIVTSEYWIRRPVECDPIYVNLNSLFESDSRSYEKVMLENTEGECWLKFKIFNRSTSVDESNGFLTLTFVLINEILGSTDSRANTRNILFQNELEISTSNKNLITPYVEKHSSIDTTEEKELNLLYRKKRIYAIGHGASVVWKTEIDNGYEKVCVLKTSIIPNFDLPQVAPTAHVELSMFELSDLGNWHDAKKALRCLDQEYSKWINLIEKEATDSPELENYREAALNNIKKCRISLNRIQKGIKLLLEADEDSDLVNCFRWMNRAMIWQQQRSKTKLRKWIRTGSGVATTYILEGIDNTDQDTFESLKEFYDRSPYNGRWRPFQLAFVLMNIESIVNENSEERKIVDLIWFPTGGGKTEAYLGLTAFNIFYRRIQGKPEWNWDNYGGTTVLMRYTLRLLTTQQYERAASLISACEVIRMEKEMELGDKIISIGLWVGGSSTPNTNENARGQYRQLQKDNKAEYNFVVMKCPCCGAQIGKIEQPSTQVKTKGLKREDGRNGRILFQCDNSNCEFASDSLPLQVVDEYIYENPPTLVLGTVDKFAMISWKKDSGKLFGFRTKDSINYRIKPPELIIQDELHLIAGPLGTMVGLFETMIQTLCNNYKISSPPFIDGNFKNFIPPKIVASSATISRAYEQVKSLYGINHEDQLNIFPPQGLEFGDTWFSEEKSLKELDGDSQKWPGRRYVGVLTPGYPSAQTTIVRSYAAVLQSVKQLSQKKEFENIDYYWTLMGYFNSIRELGGASSLVHGDIRERLGQIQNRELVTYEQKRYINRIEELTSRISSSDIPNTLKKLEEPFSSNNKALDICLATNMVATGVDISRLGLMFIHGQPKTTAEYIQASSRVGRKIPDGPGIIFTLYSPSKPRDKSQYEQFQGYHSRIYSNVEPTSVTPFSINARERGIHSVLIGLVRHFSNSELRDNPTSSAVDFDTLISIFSEVIVQRCETINPEEVKNTEELLQKRVRFWKKGFDHYGDPRNAGILNNPGFYPLMYANGSEVKDEIIIDERSLPTPTSMRGVDTESVLSVYSNIEQDE